MRIELYKSKAEGVKLNKLDDLELLFSIEGTLREGASLLNPSLLFQFDIENIKKNRLYEDNTGIRRYLCAESHPIIYNKVSNLIECNYVYIDEFHRFYFVDNITSIRKNLWQIDLTVDTLMSFSKEILNLDAFVSRNEFEYDNMIKDDLVSFYYDKNVYESNVDRGSAVNTIFTPSFNLVNNHFALTVINDLTVTGFSGIIDTPVALLPNVSSVATGTNTANKTYALDISNLRTLFNALAGTSSNLSDGVLSCIVYPFVIPAYSTESTLRIKDTAVSNVHVHNITNYACGYLVVADFTLKRESFLDYEPFTTYELWIPYCQWVSLSADQILNKRIIVVYEVDYANGGAQASIIDTSANLLLWTGTCQLGVKIPVTSTNAYDLENAKFLNNIGLGLNVVSAGLSVGMGVASSNPLAVAGGSLSLAKGITSFIGNANQNYLKASGGVSSSSFGLYLPQNVRIRKTKMKPKAYSDEWASLYGKPLNQFKKIRDLKGFTVIGDVHMEGFTTATDREIADIESLLKKGIIL